MLYRFFFWNILGILQTDSLHHLQNKIGKFFFYPKNYFSYFVIFISLLFSVLSYSFSFNLIRNLRHDNISPLLGMASNEYEVCAVFQVNSFLTLNDMIYNTIHTPNLIQNSVYICTFFFCFITRKILFLNKHIFYYHK